ncbi:hypothetical protein QQP08_016387 [Theobroma cacao]|nr:hypothetical protein QQP08_016387 [Theobroma cacao]
MRRVIVFVVYLMLEACRSFWDWSSIKRVSSYLPKLTAGHVGLLVFSFSASIHERQATLLLQLQPEVQRATVAPWFTKSSSSFDGKFSGTEEFKLSTA